MQDNKLNTRILLNTVYFIYFFCGLAQCFESIFPNEFMEYFQLNNTQWSYTSAAKNIPFLLLSVGIGYLAGRIGYKNCLTIAMFLYAAGSALIIAGLQMHTYPLVLFAFFIVGTGFNFQLVAGNPMLSQLGDSSGSASRLNLGNALGAIAWIVAPLFITLIVPVTVVQAAAKVPYMINIFVVIAIVLAITGFFTMFAKDVNLDFQPEKGGDQAKEKSISIWKSPKVLLGFIAIFLVLGTEAGIFTFFQVYLKEIVNAMDPEKVQHLKQSLKLDLNRTQLIFTFFFALYALGRLLASAIQKKIQPAYTVIACLLISITFLIILVTGVKGILAILVLTILGLFISSLFPTLYALAIEGMGSETAKASGLLTMGFLGGALIPLLQGRIADLVNLRLSFTISIITYSLVLVYAMLFTRFHKPSND